MFFDELLDNLFVKEDDLNDDEILLIPKGIRTGIDFNLVVNRTDFENLLVKYRSVEPMSEVILYALGTAGSGDIDRSDPIWNTVLSTSQVVEKFTNLCNSYVQSKLEQVEENKVFLLVTPSYPTVVEEEINAEQEDYDDISLSNDSFKDVEEDDIPVFAGVPEQSNDDLEFIDGTEDEYTDVEENKIIEDVEFDSPSSEIIDEENNLVEDGDKFANAAESAFVPPNMLSFVEEGELEDAVEEDMVNPGESIKEQIDSKSDTTVEESIDELEEVSAIATEEEYTMASVANDKFSEIDDICFKMLEVITRYGISNVCKVVGRSLDDVVIMLVNKVPEVKTYLLQNIEADCEDVEVWCTFVEIVKQASKESIIAGDTYTASQYLEPFKYILYEE